MALTNQEIDQLLAGGFLSPPMAEAMKRQNNAALASSVAPNGAGPIAGVTMAAKSSQAAGLPSAPPAPVAPNVRPVAASPTAMAPKAAINMAGGPALSPYVDRVNAPGVGSPAGSYMSPTTVMAAQKNGGIIPAGTEGVPAYGPKGIAPGGPITTEQQFAKVPNASDESKAKAINPALVNGLKEVGAISPETAEKMHALNDEEKKKKKKSEG